MDQERAHLAGPVFGVLGLPFLEISLEVLGRSLLIPELGAADPHAELRIVTPGRVELEARLEVFKRLRPVPEIEMDAGPAMEDIAARRIELRGPGEIGDGPRTVAPIPPGVGARVEGRGELGIQLDRPRQVFDGSFILVQFESGEAAKQMTEREAGCHANGHVEIIHPLPVGLLLKEEDTAAGNVDLRVVAAVFRSQGEVRQGAIEVAGCFTDLAAFGVAEGGFRLELDDFPEVIKADVQGSVETLAATVTQANTEEVKIRVLHAAAGPITESDVELADASDAVIIGFHVVADDKARAMAEHRRVEVRLYTIIYEILDDLKKALSGLLAPEIREKFHGRAEIRAVYKFSKVGNIAGCMVVDGHIQRGSKIRLIRNGVIVTEDMTIETLRRLKDDVREVKQGFECGIKVAGYDDIKIGDVLEAYIRETIQRTL